MGGDRQHGRIWAGACVLLLIVAGVVLWSGWRAAKFEFGDVDPAGVVVGLVALAAALWAGRQTAQAQRTSDTDTVVWADRLARAVLAAETRQRDQLLGELGRTIDVVFTLQPAPAHNVRGARPGGTLANVADYFGELRPQRLVITGAPGAGKTVLAVELILELLKRRKPGDPVPVRISAASWNPDNGVQTWLVTHLVHTFQLRKATAQALADAYQIIPVIDGLDEMDSDDDPGYGSRAGQALRVLNRYQQGRDKARLVLTCRTGQYQALTAGQVWAHDAARIELAPVTPDQAGAFIEAAAGTDQLPRWQPVLHALNHPGHPLAEALATPWRLTLAVTVYQQQHPHTGAYLRDPADLTGYSTADQIRDHLLQLFIGAATAAATVAGRNPYGYRPEQVRAWLTVLARYLTSNATRPPFAGRNLSSTDLVLHELWPLAGNRIESLTLILAAVSAAMYALLAAAIRPLPLACLGLPVFSFLLINAWHEPWPQPGHLDLTRLKTRRGRRRLIFGIAFGFVFGLAVGLAFGLAVFLFTNEHVIEPAIELGVGGGLAIGLGGGLTGGIVGGLVGGLNAPDIPPSTDPRAPLRNYFTGWLIFGLAIGLTGGLALKLALEFGSALGIGFNGPIAVGTPIAIGVGLVGGIAGGIATGLKVGLYGGFIGGIMGVLVGVLGVGLTVGLTSMAGGGPVVVRYLMLLIVMKKHLPWRLGRFLHWCYADAGLLRIAGIGYQFRHRELQDHLAALLP